MTIGMPGLASALPLILAACATTPPMTDVPVAAPAMASAAEPTASPAPEKFDRARLSDHIRILGSDEYEGRAPATAGETKTIAYLIDQFAKAGLEPGGAMADGKRGWTQPVPLLRSEFVKAPHIGLTLAGWSANLTQGEEISVRAPTNGDKGIKLDKVPLVFAGYGVKATERGWDDFKGVDLKGKVALLLVNDPDFEAAPGEPVAGKFGGKTMTYYGRWTYKFEEAARRGAIGAIIIHETEGAGYGWNVVEGPGGENFNIVLPPGAQQPVLLQGWIQQAAAKAMLKRAGHDYAALKRQARMVAFRPIELKASLSASAGVDLARITSHNVIGKLTGGRYPSETVSYSGHWDAFGIGAPDAQGRTVRPGAADDALGMAAMIEIARLFAAGPRPQRTLVFAAWTAEERGLLGSEYYAQHPLFPHETMVANLTFDTLQWAGPTRDTVLIGRGQSELERYLEEGARAQGRYVTPEGRPERGLFYRADHFTLAKRGVPVLLSLALAGAYDLQNGGRAAGQRWLDAFTTNCYHETCDAWSPDWDLRGAAQEAELYYGIGTRLANSRDWPQWNAGSEFKEVRDKSTNARSPGAQPPPPGERG